MFTVKVLASILSLVVISTSGQQHNFNFGPDLSNLGNQIQQQVQQSLEPVRALQTVMAVKEGRGGTTVISYQPSGKQLIAREGKMYQCSGGISESEGECSGNLELFKLQSKEDYCYMNIKTRVNNNLCFTSSGVMNIIDGKCSSPDGNEVLQIPVREYKTMCQNLARGATYKYISQNPVNTHKAPNLVCNGSKPTICTFTETSRV